MAVPGMIDIETLGVDPGCVVLTIGGIKFNPYSNAEPHDGLYIRCNVDEQTELGRTVDENTLAWWNKQDPKIKVKINHNLKTRRLFLYRLIIPIPKVKLLPNKNKVSIKA